MGSLDPPPTTIKKLVKRVIIMSETEEVVRPCLGPEAQAQAAGGRGGW